MNASALKLARHAEKVLRNGKPEENIYRREYVFGGTHNRLNGDLHYDQGMEHSEPYQRYEHAGMKIYPDHGPDLDSFAIHAHGFSPTTSSFGPHGDIASATTQDENVFTFMPESSEIEIVMPGGRSGYSGSMYDAFPSLRN